MRKFVIALAVFCLALLSGCSGRKTSAVIAAGSTSVQPYAEILAEEYAHLYPGSEIDVQGGGSSAGITAAMSGTAEIGMSSRSLKESEAGLWSVEIAKDGLAIVVNPENPVNVLTLDQLRGIYAGEIGSWGDVGGLGAKIHVIAREEGSGTRSAFEELVMSGLGITPKGMVCDSNGAVKQLVAGDVNAVGFISLGLVDESVKALRLEGIEATTENIINGGYKLSRPFLLVVSGEPEGAVKQFIGFILSDEGRRILESEGLIPPERTANDPTQWS